MVEEHGSVRDLSLISVEGRAGGHHCAVELTQYQNGLKTTRRLADNGSHGNWIQWLEKDEPQTVLNIDSRQFLGPRIKV